MGRDRALDALPQINYKTFVGGIESNQTRELFDKYVEILPGQMEITRLLDQVNLKTPEYTLELIYVRADLDMSAYCLSSLYKR